MAQLMTRAGAAEIVKRVLADPRIQRATAKLGKAPAADPLAELTDAQVRRLRRVMTEDVEDASANLRKSLTRLEGYQREVDETLSAFAGHGLRKLDGGGDGLRKLEKLGSYVNALDGFDETANKFLSVAAAIGESYGMKRR